MREVRENEVCLGYTKPRKRRSNLLDTRSSRLDQALKTVGKDESPICVGEDGVTPKNDESGLNVWVK